jgi:NCS2 family nucleobase:cation symporter-2
LSILSSLLAHLRYEPTDDEGDRKPRPPVKPAGVTWAVNQRPPALVLWVAALQHVLLATVTTAFPLLVCEAAGVSHDTTRQVLSASLLAAGIGSVLLSLRSRRLGTGALMPASFSGIFFTTTVAAAHQGGLPLVAGMTILSGLLQIVIGRLIHLLRPYLPTEIAGFAMLMSGLTLGIIGFNLITGVSVASAVMSTSMEPSAALGLACLLTMIGLYVWGAERIRLYVVLIVLAGGYAIGAALGFVPFSEMRSAKVIVEVPQGPVDWPSFAFNFIVPFAVATIGSSLRSIGDLGMVQKINDANWQRPDFGMIRRGLVANGIATTIGGMLGTVPLSTASTTVGLTLTTGVNSRVVGLAAGVVFVVLAFLPAAHELIILAPRTVLGGALVFTSCFTIVGGMQAMVGRLMDGRRTLVVAVALLLAFTRYLFPNFYNDAPIYLQALVSSPLSMGMIPALTLNALFRIGIKRTASIEFTPGADAFDQLEQFADTQGGIWGARRDVIQRASRAMFETVEALELLIDPGTRARITMTFDEYWLSVTTEYQGKPLVTSAAAPHHDELLADDSQLTRLSGVILRRLASRLSTESSGGGQRIRLGFEH